MATSTSSSRRSRDLALLMEYQRHPSIKIRNELVRRNAGLVRKIAHRISHQASEPYEDLEQIGQIGLIRAVERFNPNQGYAFSSFAVPYIRGEILHFLRDRSSAVKIPRRWQDLQKAAQKVQLELTRELQRTPTQGEIAEALQVTSEEWYHIKMARKNRMPLSLDATLQKHTESTLTLGDTLPDMRSQILQYAEEDRQQLQQAMSQLEEKTQIAMQYVFFEGLTRKEVAQKIGVSPMTITRWIKQGIREMIAYIHPQSVEKVAQPQTLKGDC